MADTQPIQIHVVYSSRQEPVAARSGRYRTAGTLTFLVGIAWLYVIWNPVWKWIEAKAMIGEIVMVTGLAADAGTPSGVQGLNVLTQIINDQPKQQKEEANQKAAPQKRVHGSLAVTAATWMIIATGVGLWLVMAGAANLSTGNATRRLGRYIFPLSILLIAALAWYVWKKYEWYESILPAWVRPGLFVLGILMAMSAGAMVNRRGRGALRSSAYLVVGSAIFSVIAIWTAVRLGHMPVEHVDTSLYAKVFGVQSAYGWLLLLGTLRRR